MARSYTFDRAVGTLTLTGNLNDADTVTVGGKVYTLQATLTNSDGNVHIGANAAGTIQNLVAAINLSDEGESATSAGTDYAAAMTQNAEVFAVSYTATTLVVEARTPGSVGNLIASTETSTAASWGGATLASGAGNFSAWADDLIAMNQVNSEVAAELHYHTADHD